MRRLLNSIIHYVGTGRALENARQQREELHHMAAALDALEERLSATVEPLGEPAAA
jgi:hypothetical protein